MVDGTNSVVPRRPEYPLGEGDSWMATNHMTLVREERASDGERIPWMKSTTSGEGARRILAGGASRLARMEDH
jgi:hypothetical protein